MVTAGFNPVDGGSMLLSNVRTHLPYCMVSQTRELQHRSSWP